MSKVVKYAKNFLDEHSLEFCAAINSITLDSKLKLYDSYINKVTQDVYKRDLMKAITIEEQLHQYPFQTFIEDNIPNKLAQRWDIADSVGPSQIRVSLWADFYQTNREDLINPQTHFVTMNKHMDYIFSRIEIEKLPSTPDWVGTIWCNMNANKVSLYGKRVNDYYNALQSKNPGCDS